MIRRSGFKCRIEVSNRPCVFNCIIAERLMKIRTTKIALSLRQGIDKFCNFSDAILRQFLDSVDEFLLFHKRIYSTLSRIGAAHQNQTKGSLLFSMITPPFFQAIGLVVTPRSF